MKIHFSEIETSIIDVKEDKRNECFNWGKDNAFPSLVNALSSLSVTAKTCIDRVAKAMYGGGLKEHGGYKINSMQTLDELDRLIKREYAKQSNVFLHIGFDGNCKPSSITLLPSTYVRIGKGDDTGYSGMFLVYDNWDKKKAKKIIKKSFKKVHRFNMNKAVIQGQIGIKEGDSIEVVKQKTEAYNGQILHIYKDSTYKYGMSDLEGVLNDALAEYNASVFRQKGGSKGFLNTKVMAVREFTNDDDRQKYKKSMKSYQGAENAGSVALLEVPKDVEDLSKALYVADMSTPYNDKLFEYSEKQAERNICKAYLVPLVLVNQDNSGVFGNSGAMLFEAKKQLFEDKEEERIQLTSGLNRILKHFEKPIQIEVVNPYEKEEIQEEATDENKKAQAVLRGSVGGVTSLLAIQASVSAKTTTKEAGVSMIVNLFGFSEEIAEEMLGEPIIKEENNG